MKAIWCNYNIPQQITTQRHALTSSAYWYSAQWRHTSAGASGPRRSRMTRRTEVQWHDVWLHWQRGTCIRSRPHHPADRQPVQLDHRVSLSSETWTHVAMPTPGERNICHHNSSICRTPHHRSTTHLLKKLHWRHIKTMLPFHVCHFEPTSTTPTFVAVVDPGTRFF